MDQMSIGYFDRPWSNFRLFAQTLQSPGMYLKCVTMAFDHPVYGVGHPVRIQSEHWEPRWHLAFDLFGLCPLEW